MLHTPKWNLKRVVYRSFGLFVEVLGKLYRLETNSGFDIIRSLIAKQFLDQIFGDNLLFAATAAYYLRLISYAKENSQNDYLRCPEKPEEYAKTFEEWIGITSAVLFFEVVLKLQRLTSCKIGLIGEEDFDKYSNVHYHLHSCWLLRQFSDAAEYCTELLNNSKSSIYDVAFASHTLYQCGSDAYHAKNYLKATKLLFEAINHWKFWQHRLTEPEIYLPADVACRREKIHLQDEKSLMEQQIKIYQEVVAHTFNRLGRCFYQEGLFYLALEQHEVAVQLTIDRDVVEQETVNTNIASYLKNMGKCMFEIHRWNAANGLFAKAVNVWKESEHQSFLPDIEECNSYMQRCKLFLQDSQVYGESFVQPSLSELENPKIVVDHCKEYDVPESQASDFQCRPGSAAHLADSTSTIPIKICEEPVRPNETQRSWVSDVQCRNVITEDLIKMNFLSPPLFYDTNTPTHTCVVPTESRPREQQIFCRHCIIA